MEKYVKATLVIRTYNVQNSEYVEKEFIIGARVEKIFETTKRYYSVNGHQLSKRISFPTPRISGDEAANESFAESIHAVIINGVRYGILSSNQSNKRTTLELRSVL